MDQSFNATIVTVIIANGDKLSGSPWILFCVIITVIRGNLSILIDFILKIDQKFNDLY